VESAGADGSDGGGGGGGGGAASAALDGHEGAARMVLKVPTPTEERRSRREEGRVAGAACEDEDGDGDDPECRGRGRGASSAQQPPARRASDIGRAPPWEWSRWSFTGGPLMSGSIASNHDRQTGARHVAEHEKKVTRRRRFTSRQSSRTPHPLTPST